MKNCVVAFRNILSDNIDLGLQKIISILNAGGIFTSDICILNGDKLDEFTLLLQEGSDKYDNIIVLPLKENFEKVQSAANLSSKSNIFVLSSNNELSKELLSEKVIPLIESRFNTRYSKTVIKAFCIDENIIANAVNNAQKLCGDCVKVLYHQKHLDFFIEVIYDKHAPKILTDDIIRTINRELFDYIYSNDGESLSLTLLNLLKLRKLKVSFAESFTGGGLASSIIENSGASQSFIESVVCYNNSSKMDRLGVSVGTLNEHDAVSDQTVYEMALGLLNSEKCDVAVATSGYAEAAENSNEPAGLCFIAVGFSDEIEINKFYFKENREDITMAAINAALFLTIKKIK